MREARLASFEVCRRAFGEHRCAGAFEQLFEGPLRARKFFKCARLAHGFERRAEVKPIGVHYDALHQIADEDDLVFEAVFFSEFVFFLVEYLKKSRPYVAASGERYFVYHRSVLRRWFVLILLKIIAQRPARRPRRGFARSKKARARRAFRIAS